MKLDMDRHRRNRAIKSRDQIAFIVDLKPVGLPNYIKIN